MALLKTLIKHGTSRAIIIDRPVLDMLEITDETPLQVETDGRRLIISPVREAPEQARKRLILEASSVVHKKYARAFKNLAEGPR